MSRDIAETPPAWPAGLGFASAGHLRGRWPSQRYRERVRQLSEDTLVTERTAGGGPGTADGGSCNDGAELRVASRAGTRRLPPGIVAFIVRGGHVALGPAREARIAEMVEAARPVWETTGDRDALQQYLKDHGCSRVEAVFVPSVSSTIRRWIY
ncbi:hypothetical protein GCM10009753_65880 [Streptantibioticus ferralitis]